MIGSLEFGSRQQHGDITTVKNSNIGSDFPAITNREFSEVKDYIIANSETGASDLVFDHLVALFGNIPTKKVDSQNPEFSTLVIMPVGPYNKNTFTSHINQAVGFGYTIIEQDSPLRSWKIYYMSLGNNTYCATYSTTFRRITVSSRT